jgi:hypothetical protein
VVVKSGANDWSGQMLTGGQVKAAIFLYGGMYDTDKNQIKHCFY